MNNLLLNALSTDSVGVLRRIPPENLPNFLTMPETSTDPIKRWPLLAFAVSCFRLFSSIYRQFFLFSGLVQRSSLHRISPQSTDHRRERCRPSRRQFDDSPNSICRRRRTHCRHDEQCECDHEETGEVLTICEFHRFFRSRALVFSLAIRAQMSTSSATLAGSAPISPFSLSIRTQAER